MTGEAGSSADESVVLLVEDNRDMRALIRSFVEDVTPRVHECECGEDAVDVYAVLRPDWVLMDLRLGGMSGLAATRAIRRMDPDARVIVVTEHGDERTRRRARAVGASGFVEKENLLRLTSLLAASPKRTGEGGNEA